MELHIDLLSRPIRVADGSGEDVPVTAARTQLVLAMLVLARGERVGRDVLADAVWPDRLPDTWESALRNIVADVRSCFVQIGLDADSLRSEDHGYRLELPDGAEIDVDRAADALRHAEQATGGDAKSVAAYADLTSGILASPLLPDHDGDWVSDQRADLVRSRVRALDIGAECALVLGHRGAAAERSEALLAIDELREYNHQLLIRAHIADGDRGLAVLSFDHCREVFARELGIEPSAETLRLGREARGDSLEPTHPQTVPPTVAIGTAPPNQLAQFAVPFVGRSHELARLDQAWMRARSGDRVVALIEGEAGIGKTRLALELARLVSERDGAIVLIGHNDEQRLGSYQPFVEAFGRYASTSDPERLERQLGPDGPLLRDTLERTRGSGETADGDGQREVGQRPRFAALSAFLSRIASETPTLLFLDDIHWMGPDSVAVLRYVLRHGTGSLLVLGTAREPELSESDSLAELLLDATRSETLERIVLDGFDRETSVAYAAAILDIDIDESTARLAFELHQRSRGNPFFLGELVRFHVPAGALESVLPEVPTGVRSMIRGRRRHLDDATNDLLDAASVVGRKFEVAVLREMRSTAAADLELALDDASASMLIHEGSGPGRYEFSHQLVHDAVYTRIRAMRRARLHLDAGEALERLRDAGRSVAPAVLARHFVAARGATTDPDSAIRYVLAAAQHFIDTFEYDEAITETGVALKLDPSSMQRCRVLLTRGAALQRAGDASEAHAAFQQALDLARSLDAGVEFAEAALGLVVGGRGVSAWLTDDIRRSLLEEAIDNLGADWPLMRIQLLGALAETLYGPDRWDRRHALAKEAAELARSIGDAPALVAALDANRVALWGPGNTTRRLEVTTSILDLGTRLGDDDLKARACLGRLCDLIELGDRVAVDAELALARDMATELHQPRFSSELTLMDAMLAFAEGRRDEAETLAAKSERIWGIDEAPDATRARSEQVLLMAYAKGEIRESTVDSIAGVIAKHPELGAYVCAYPFVLASVGRHQEARERLDAIATRGYVDVPQHSSWLFSVALLSEAAARVGAVARAGELEHMLAPHAGRFVFLVGPHVLWGSVDHQLGILSGSLGRIDESIAHLESAMHVEEQFGARTFVARSQLALTRIR